jgi:transcriptional regulator with XRE-family HTH domain
VVKTSYQDAGCSQVANILRGERERRGVSMTRLAEMSGLSQGMISLVEHEHRNPSLETMLRICQALKIVGRASRRLAALLLKPSRS